MAEPVGSDSFGRFFSFPTDATTDVDPPEGSYELLKSLLSDIDPGAENAGIATTSSPPQPQQHLMQLYHPPAFPISRFEVVAENSSGVPNHLQDGCARVDASSSGGTQPEVPKAHEPQLISHKERNRAAQKKFRERQRARTAMNNKKMEELERKLAELMSEKKGLEAQKKLLQHTVMVNATHYSELEAQQQAFEIQQEVLLMDTARIYRRCLDRPDLTLEKTKQFTMAAFLNVFEHFLGRYKLLLEQGGREPSSPAYKELHELVYARRLEEARIAMFSKWASGQLAWNREEMRQGMTPPSEQFYVQVLASLELSPEQQQEWLGARRRLLEQVADIRQRRQKIALSLGLLLMYRQNPDGTSAEERQMRASLEEEREAVLAFLYHIIDCNLAPLQEVILDVSCYPWWPCLWTMTNLLAAKQKKEPPDTLHDTDSQPGDPLIRFSAAELLREPMLARMGGLQLKRTVVTVPTPENVLAAVKLPEPTIATMRDMTVFEVMCGKHLDVTSPPGVSSPI